MIPELLSKVEELEKEKAEKELKSFEIKLDIKPEYHPKIIGHKGGVISKFRTDFDVNIQLPKRDHPEQSTITITGFESNALKARDAIMKKIEEYVSMLGCVSTSLNLEIPQVIFSAMCPVFQATTLVI